MDISKITFSSRNLPDDFSGSRIVHISDLHNRTFGRKQKELIKITKQLHPDYIFITGDLIDQHHRNIDSVCCYLEAISDMAPIYYVTGNHEWETRDKGKELFSFMKNKGIHILHDRIVEIEKGSNKIQLLGIDDPYKISAKRKTKSDALYSKEFLKRFIRMVRNKKQMFTVLLSHRPEFIHFYAKANIDLVFSGHAHGGQFRIPGIGGVLAPHQGFFPKYTEGMICESNTCMVVSRGLGNSGFPFRINNSPEVVLVTLIKIGSNGGT